MNKIYQPYYVKEYWWKFANFISYFFNGSIDSEVITAYTPTREAFMSALAEWSFSYLEDDYKELVEVKDAQILVKQPVYDIFMLLENRYKDHYVFCTNHEVNAEAQEEARKFFHKLFNVIQYTYKKYAKVIDLLNENYNDLMKQLSTESESGSRYNDTPQEEEVELSYEANVFTTTLTKSKSVVKQDSNTPIVKIEEIFRNYRNVLLDWLNEFDSLFVEVHNV